ncbi:arylsulfatase [Kiritimatiellota bacterium B12222]|nr:arylsulfatase [Kiritimatiellota bacterium B12222]
MTEATQKPNVVLIIADQWRGDCLGLDGHPVLQTPYLDHNISRGCHFGRAYAATPSCIPARASLLTGLTQGTHGRVGYKDGVPWDYPTSIAKSFSDQGYQTHCVGKMHVYPERNTFGFDSVDLHDGYLHFGRNRTKGALEQNDDYLAWLRVRDHSESDYYDSGNHCNFYTPHPWDKEERFHPSSWVSTMGIDFLRRQDPTRPFFLTLSFHRPHPPLDPPAWAYEDYLGMDIPEPVNADWNEKMFGEKCKANADKIRRIRAAYYAQMTFIDHQINRFIETHDEYGHFGNTIFCFTADHGDMLGDHDLYAKSVSYEGSARVPLGFFSPGSDRIPFKSCDQDHVAELRDIMPTLLDLAGLDIPEAVEGKSLAPVIKGEEVAWREYLHGEHIVNQNDIGAMHYIVSADYKYIWCSGNGAEQLFDLRKDPRELHDLSVHPEQADRLTSFREKLIHELKDREEDFVSESKLVSGREVSPVLRFLKKE